MAIKRSVYKWFYDNIHSRYYDLMMKWLLLPFSGEANFRREMLEPVDFTGDEVILDICCGTGGITLRLNDKTGGHGLIVGSDLSEGQVRAAVKKNRFKNVYFVVADGTRPCFRTGAFDKVIIPHALHEMDRGIRLRLLSEAKGLLKTRGQTIVLELDDGASFFRRLFQGLWLLYWLPFNPETPTRRDMLKRRVEKEMEETGYTRVRKVPRFKGTMQTVVGDLRV